MRMTIVGRNPRAGASECIVFGHVGRATDRFAPVSIDRRRAAAKDEELDWRGAWEIRPMRPGAGLELAPALVGVDRDIGYCRTTGRLVLVSHRWSGVLEINNIGRRYVIDLYSEETRLVLMDVVREILVDVTPLAIMDDGALKLPPLPAEALLRHIVEREVWFRFLERDATFRPGLLRRAIELCRAQPGRELKLKVVAALLPKLATRPTVAAAAQPQAAEDSRLRDELRLLAAAVDGLALRAAAEV